MGRSEDAPTQVFGTVDDQTAQIPAVDDWPNGSVVGDHRMAQKAELLGLTNSGEHQTIMVDGGTETIEATPIPFPEGTQFFYITVYTRTGGSLNSKSFPVSEYRKRQHYVEDNLSNGTMWLGIPVDIGAALVRVADVEVVRFNAVLSR